MKHGFTNMLRKKKGRVKSGSTVVRLAAKKRARLIQNQDHAHCFFYIRGVVHHEFVPRGKTVNAAFYVEVLKRLDERMRCVQPELWAERTGSCITTMHPHTRHLLRFSFSPKTT
jgi:hypothetical protein